MTATAEHLRWPEVSVCGFDWCPGGWCLECHETAYQAMLIARRNLVCFMAGSENEGPSDA